MNNQEIFNKVWEHASRMSKRCEEDDTCLYRSEDGRNACFIGALLDDKTALEWNKEGGITEVFFSNVERPQWLSEDSLDFLEDLQMAHDTLTNWSPEGFLFEALREVADTHKLNVPG